MTACIDDATEDGAEPAVNQVALDLSIAGGVTWPSSTPLKLGTTALQSCFLSGVKGDLVAVPPHLAFAQVFPKSDGFWYAQTSGSNVTAVVTCINTPYPGGGMELGFENNTTGGQVFVQAHRRCFLRRVAASIGFQHNIEDPFPPKLGITNDGSQWGWGDSFMSEDVENGNDYGDATALCVDVPNSTTAWGFPIQGAAGLTNTVTLKDGDGNPIATAGTECALSEISGRWDLADPVFGSNAGITLANSGTNWTVTTIGARAGRVSCWR